MNFHSVVCSSGVVVVPSILEAQTNFLLRDKIEVSQQLS